MNSPHEFLTNLALVLGVAGVTTLIFQRLRQPVVFGYLLAGLLVGPYTSVPLVANAEITQTLAELGVIMLLFSLGLEFTLRKLVKVGPTAGVVALFQGTAMIWVGYLVARMLGWTALEAIYTGAMVAISSTTIIMKAFAEQGVRDRYTRLVFGVLIVQDLIAIFLLTMLTAISAGRGISAATIGATALDLALFLAVLIAVGLLVVPRLLRFVVALGRNETTLVASVAICFVFALAAVEFGYSVALGAFVAGSLVAESGHARLIERLVQPVTDMFGAIFFVAVGMLIDLRMVADNWLAVLVLSVAVIAGNIIFVSIAAFATGQGVRASIQSGMSLAQIGEFSFIIATLGLSLGAIRSFLYPVAVAVSAVTALFTPIFIKHSGGAAEWVDRKLPRRWQTYVALYGSWIERLSTRQRTKAWMTNRRVLLLLGDASLLIGVVIVTAVKLDDFTAKLSAATALTPQISRWLLIAAASVVAAPMIYGIFRLTQALSHQLAVHAFPEKPKGQVDMAVAPRNTMEVTLHLLMVVVIGGLVVVITQPFLPLFRGALLLAVVLAVLGVALWRSAANLQGHTRAGAEIIAMALSRQMAKEPDEVTARIERVQATLPGLGEPVPVTIPGGSRVVGKTLGDIDLRGKTGATVLTILHQGGDEALLPNGHERLGAGDVVFLAGTNHSVRLARGILINAMKPTPEIEQSHA
jgi:CPA2 family monovalent cation:H+ antiporter-2